MRELGLTDHNKLLDKRFRSRKRGRYILDYPGHFVVLELVSDNPKPEFQESFYSSSEQAKRHALYSDYVAITRRIPTHFARLTHYLKSSEFVTLCPNDNHTPLVREISIPSSIENPAEWAYCPECECRVFRLR